MPVTDAKKGGKPSARDPYWKMKMALAQSVLSEKDPTPASLERTFLEEFGSPPPARIIEAFKKKLQERDANQVQLKRPPMRLNIIREWARQRKKEKKLELFEAGGGQYIHIPMEAHEIKNMDLMKKIFGTDTNRDIFVLAMKMLEQKARATAPELFLDTDQADETAAKPS